MAMLLAHLKSIVLVDTAVVINDVLKLKLFRLMKWTSFCELWMTFVGLGDGRMADGRVHGGRTEGDRVLGSREGIGGLGVGRGKN